MSDHPRTQGVRLVTWVSQSTKGACAEAAKEQGIPVSQFVRQALWNAITQQKTGGAAVWLDWPESRNEALELFAERQIFLANDFRTQLQRIENAAIDQEGAIDEREM